MDHASLPIPYPCTSVSPSHLDTKSKTIDHLLNKPCVYCAYGGGGGRENALPPVELRATVDGPARLTVTATALDGAADCHCDILATIFGKYC